MTVSLPLHSVKIDSSTSFFKFHFAFPCLYPIPIHDHHEYVNPNRQSINQYFVTICAQASACLWSTRAITYRYPYPPPHLRLEGLGLTVAMVRGPRCKWCKQLFHDQEQGSTDCERAHPTGIQCKLCLRAIAREQHLVETDKDKEDLEKKPTTLCLA